MRRQLKTGCYQNPDEMAIATDELWEDGANTISAASYPGGKQCHRSPPASQSGGNQHH